MGCPETLQGTRQAQNCSFSPAQPSPPHRVSDLESYTRLETWDDLVVETGGVEGQRQFLREVTHFQLHLRADFLSRKGQKKVWKWAERKWVGANSFSSQVYQVAMDSARQMLRFAWKLPEENTPRSLFPAVFPAWDLLPHSVPTNV